MPGSVFRYINAGPNVLGAAIRDLIEKRGLPYHQTMYGILIDRLGMASYQHSADIAGNLIASGAGFATLRDYAKLGVLYLQNGMWDGERLLPAGWADYATTRASIAEHADASLWPKLFKMELQFERDFVKQGGLFLVIEMVAFALNVLLFDVLVQRTPLHEVVARLVGTNIVYLGFSLPMWSYFVFRRRREE